MKMRSPIIAMLWEQWQLTRVEAAQRVSLGIVGGSAALVLFDSATATFWILIAVHAFFWFSISKLNGGKFADGYKPGFPLHLLYTRPVPTAVLVGVAMAYDAVSCTALYLASAALLGFAFGQPLPSFSVALCLVAYHLACTCIQWSTRSRAVQWIASAAVAWPFFFWLWHRVVSPLAVEFSLAENALMVLIGIVSFSLAVAGVARQRRGDSVASAPQPKEVSGGYPGWMIHFFRFPCPTSSATRARVWFELKSSGLPVLTIGLAIAMLIVLLFAISIPFAPVRNFAIGIAMFSVMVVLFALGGNAFGIRRKQGRIYASTFEMTHPYGTAQMAGLKVLVRTVCVLAALIAIGVSVWASSSFVGVWGTWTAGVEGGKDILPELLKVRQMIAEEFGGRTRYALAAMAIVASIAVTAVIAWQAAREALKARHPRLVLAAEWLPAGWGLATILLALAQSNGIVSMFLLRSFFTATLWISGAVLLLAAIYLLWTGFAKRALTIRYACGALAISATFAAAWVAGMPATGIIGISWLALAILMVIVLAPWSLNRIRHA